MNAIQQLVIFPLSGTNPKSPTWAFDDPRHGLDAEPFVCGAEKIITKMAKLRKLNIKKNLKLTFSATPFPNHQAKLDRIGGQDDKPQMGNTYAWEAEQMQGWLCPALFHYFKKAPETIYASVEQA